MAVEIRLDGVIPLWPTGNLLPWCSDDNYKSHSVSAVANNVFTGHRTVQVFWKIVNNAPDGDLLAEVSDWSLLLLVRD